MRIALGLALFATASAAAAQTRPPPCLSGPDAEAVALAVAPAALRAAGTACPAAPFLRAPDPRFVARLQAASDEAWPRAIQAASRLAGADMAPLLQSESLRPMLGTLIAPLIVADLKPADCPKVDRIVTLLSPLPARNIATLAITILQYAQDDAARRGQSRRLPLCPTPRP